MHFFGTFPFGDMSVGGGDCYYQYIDFLAYAKQGLFGEASPFYSFSHYLGSNTSAVWAYYCASPFNLLLAFFPVDMIDAFICVNVLFKLTFAASCMSLYLYKRFIESKAQNACTPRSGLFVLLLSMCYIFSAWPMGQMPNVMWLDELYLLPLILLGLYRLINEGKITLFSISLGLSIFCNWYIGCVGFIFVALWACVEMGFALLSASFKKTNSVRYTIKRFLLFSVASLLAVGVSAIIFVPNIQYLLASSGSDTSNSWSLYVSNYHFLSPLWNWAIGIGSTETKPALFSGSLTLVLCIGAFILLPKRTGKKILLFTALSVCFLPLFWWPAHIFMSLGSVPHGHIIRYCFIYALALIWISAWFVLRQPFPNVGNRRKIVYMGFVVLFALLQAHEGNKNITDNYHNLACLYITIFVEITLAFFFVLSLSSRDDIRKLAFICVSLIVITEVSVNCSLWLTRLVEESETNAKDIADRKAYVDSTDKLIETVNADWRTKNQADNSEAYRICQLSTWQGSAMNLNEAMTFDYKGVQGYSSLVPADQKAFLGLYADSIPNIYASKQSDIMLGLENVLGCAYVIGDIDIAGFEKLSELSNTVGSNSYYNPYAWPIAFNTHKEYLPQGYSEDAFETINEMYASVGDLAKPLFEKVHPYSDALRTDDSVTYTFVFSDDVQDNVLYADCSGLAGDLCVGGKIIHIDSLDKKWPPIRISLGNESEVNVSFVCQKEQTAIPLFYSFHLAEARNVADKLKQSEAIFSSFKDGSLSMNCVANKTGEMLYTSIPFEKGWRVLVNGKEVKPQKSYNLFIAIPLEEGENNISFSFCPPGLLVGSGCTLLSLLILGGYAITFQKRIVQTSL